MNQIKKILNNIESENKTSVDIRDFFKQEIKNSRKAAKDVMNNTSSSLEELFIKRRIEESK